MQCHFWPTQWGKNPNMSMQLIYLLHPWHIKTVWSQILIFIFSIHLWKSRSPSTGFLVYFLCYCCRISIMKPSESSWTRFWRSTLLRNFADICFCPSLEKELRWMVKPLKKWLCSVLPRRVLPSHRIIKVRIFYCTIWNNNNNNNNSAI